MERKIEIYNFSARTRQLFIRLIALVKYANSVSKVDKSAVRELVNLVKINVRFIKFYVIEYYELPGQAKYAVH